jgi:putative nucleotidyltransferase with HDIG domain
MISPPSTCPPKPPLAIPAGLVDAVRDRTGVTVRFFDADGAPLPAGGPDPSGAGPAPCGPEALADVVQTAAEAGEDGVARVPDGLAAAWPIRQHGRPTLVAAAVVREIGPAEEPACRRLLAAVGEAVRTRFALAEAANQCDSLSGALAQSFEEITLLHNVGEILRVTRPILGLLEYLCSELCETTGAEAAATCLPDEEGGDPLVVTAGEPPVAEADLPALLADLLGGAGGQPAIINYCQQEPALAQVSPALERVVVVPLPLGEGEPGAVAIFNRPRLEFGSPDVKLMRSSANATAVFIENRRLYRDLHTMMLDLVRALVSSVDAKDPYTCGHSERVAILCRELARELGLTDDEVEQAYMAGLLHDIGKIGTPEGILRKEGSLRPDERLVIGEHPDIGGRILKGIKQLQDVREAVIHHHERVDGSGYPRGVSGDDLSLLARIVGLADSFDAMTSTRPYREMMPLEVVEREIERHTGTQFDARVVEAFKRIDKKSLMEQFAEHPRSPCAADAGR